MSDLPLDLISTSPNFGTCAVPPVCSYGAIHVAYEIGGNWHVTQGNCHHWDCPRCGVLRAKEEYWRIVNGCASLSLQGYELYFQTVTTRGEGLSVSEAEANYLKWTNKLLDAYRARVKKHGGHWAYVQVTERQKRKHPHSHILSSFSPSDLTEGTVQKWKTGVDGRFMENVTVLRSDWLARAVVRSGLGKQYDISVVRSHAAVSRYIGKYLFKAALHTNDWPKGWKRVRYSQSWPKEAETDPTGFPLLSWMDWERLSRETSVVLAHGEDVFDYAAWKLRESDTIVHLSKRA